MKRWVIGLLVIGALILLRIEAFEDTEARIKCLEQIFKDYKNSFIDIKANDANNMLAELLDQIKKNISRCSLNDEDTGKINQLIDKLKEDCVHQLGTKPSEQLVLSIAQAIKTELFGGVNKLIELYQNKLDASKEYTQKVERDITELKEIVLAFDNLKQLLFVIIGVVFINILFTIMFFIIRGKNMMKIATPDSGTTAGMKQLSSQLGEIKGRAQSSEMLIGNIKEKFDEVAGKIDKLIELVKLVREEMGQYGENQDTFSSSFNKLRRDEFPATQAVPSMREHIAAEPEVELDFPRSLTDSNWKNLIIESFKERKTMIGRLIKKSLRGANIKTFLETIGKILNDKNDEIAFFNEILSHIFTLYKLMEKPEYEELKNVFLKAVYNAVRVEEIGADGDRFNSQKHEAIHGSGEGNVVKKVILPGFKRKFSDDILCKAQVEL